MQISKKESNKRLLQLAKFLNKLSPEKFDFSEWIGKNWKGKQDLSCGTTGCALGWAATMPEFRSLGLRLISVRDDYSNQKIGYVVNVDHNESFEMLSQGRSDEVSMLAAKVTFGISDKQAQHLFTPSYFGEFDRPKKDASPQEVASHIRKFVKGR